MLEHKKTIKILSRLLAFDVRGLLGDASKVICAFYDNQLMNIYLRQRLFLSRLNDPIVNVEHAMRSILMRCIGHSGSSNL